MAMQTCSPTPGCTSSAAPVPEPRRPARCAPRLHLHLSDPVDVVAVAGRPDDRRRAAGWPVKSDDAVHAPQPAPADRSFRGDRSHRRGRRRCHHRPWLSRGLWRGARGRGRGHPARHVCDRPSARSVALHVDPSASCRQLRSHRSSCVPVWMHDRNVHAMWWNTGSRRSPPRPPAATSSRADPRFPFPRTP